MRSITLTTQQMREIRAGTLKYVYLKTHKATTPKVRDVLWCKEPWKFADWTEEGQPLISYASNPSVAVLRAVPEQFQHDVLAIWSDLSVPENFDIEKRASDKKWRPASKMPKWATDIYLHVTDVSKGIGSWKVSFEVEERWRPGGCAFVYNPTFASSIDCEWKEDKQPRGFRAFASIYDVDSEFPAKGHSDV